MKSLKCDLCEHIAEGETFEDWMMALRPHYVEAHSDVMNDSSRGKEEMEALMKENRERFDAAYRYMPTTHSRRPLLAVS